MNSSRYACMKCNDIEEKAYINHYSNFPNYPFQSNIKYPDIKGTWLKNNVPLPINGFKSFQPKYEPVIWSPIGYSRDLLVPLLDTDNYIRL
jgi:hypothetical protein